MSRHSLRTSVGVVGLLVVLTVLAAASPAFAGPPLLCHPFDIGTARSLPWDGGRGWWHGRADYNLATLVSDTQALLTPSTPVIVRMETLRRAAIYASQDRQVAARLLAELTDRARTSETAGRADALAFLDAAYFVEALRQISYLGGEFRERSSAILAVIGDGDGYAMIQKSLAARPNDPAVEFAAALIAADRHRGAYAEHARKARAGASQDALLARNIHHVS
jgi:hypothetical protein